MSHHLDRRRFLQSASFAGFGIWLPRGLARGQGASPNDRLRFACIGVGGKGSGDTDQVGSLGDVVALCDIDSKRLGAKAAKFPGARTYADFRKLLEEMAPKIDAVVVSTPDHTHAPAAVMAMRLGKPVYCQKPLAHSPYEARLMRETAAERKVATQMGNQGTANPGFRSGIELIRSGVVGPVREVHVWTNRPFKYWKQAPDIVARPPEMPVPPHVAWDLFLGPAPERPYNPVYHPARLARLVGLRDRFARRHGLPHHQLAVHGPEAGTADPRLGREWRDQRRDLPRLGHDHLRVPGEG